MGQKSKTIIVFFFYEKSFIFIIFIALNKILIPVRVAMGVYCLNVTDWNQNHILIHIHISFDFKINHEPNISGHLPPYPCQSH